MVAKEHDGDEGDDREEGDQEGGFAGDGDQLAARRRGRSVRR